MRGYTTQEKISYWLFADRIPVTKLLIVSNVVTFLAITLFDLGIIPAYLSFTTQTLISAPWTLVTYPLVGMCGVLCLLFQGYWLWVAGGSLERSWGSAKFARFFFIMSAVSALGLLAGSVFAKEPIEATGLWLPLAGVTIAFAMMNPEQQILFFLIIPLKLKYLALIDVAVVLVSYGQVHLALGVCALAGCAYSYACVRPGWWSSFPRPDDGKIVRVHRRAAFSPLRAWKEHREREKLKRLFERSYRDEGGTQWDERPKGD